MVIMKRRKEIDQIWNGLIQILDDLVLVFGDEPMSMERFLEVFDIGLRTIRICYDSANIGPSKYWYDGFG